MMLALLPAMMTAQEARIALGPWLQAVGPDSFTVVWTTTQDAVAWVEVAPTDDTHFYAEQRPQYYESRFGRRPVGRLHRITVTGLEPGTAYRYRIMMQTASWKDGRLVMGECCGSGVYRQRPYSVTTLNSTSERVKFAVGNDFHEGDEKFRNLFSKIANGGYDFVCLNGDMTSAIDWAGAIEDNYLRSAVQMFASRIPMYMVRGNHENRGCSPELFMDYFPTSTGQPYYTFRQGPAFFIVLDCGEDKPDNDIENRSLALFDDHRLRELDWLRSVVNSEEFRSAPFRIVFCHMPPEDRGWHGNRQIEQLFMPVLDSAGVDLMISAHIHQYRFEKSGTRGHSFPVLCNPNRQRMDVEIHDGQIDIEIFDNSVTQTKKLTIKK